MTLPLPRSEFVRRGLFALAPVVLILLATAASATASTRQETILQDDRLFGDPGRQVEALDTADSLGIDTIHTVVVWSTLAPRPTASRKPSGFNGADLGDYDEEKWDRFDDLVRGAQARGIDLLLSPSTPAPKWASECRRKTSTCDPSPKEYQAFFTAVVKRYNGRTRDENQGGGLLPKVDRLSVLNEPNLGSWLSPSSQAPAMYRDLVYAAEKALRSGRQPRAQLLISEAAPIRSLIFYQRLFCIDSRGRALDGGQARRAGCTPRRRIKRLKATGIAHHPYSRGGEPPFKRRGSSDITLRYMDRLKTVLDQAAKAGAIKRNIPQYSTEFGIASDPPSESFGVAPTIQARELNHSEFVTYENKSVRAFAQFQLSDDTNIGQGTDPVNFQTGLRFGSGEEKPAFAAFRMPIYVTRAGNRARVWGGVRPGAGSRVDIQTESNGTFTTVTTVTVDRYGYIDENIDTPRGKVRLRWTAPNGQEFTSREANIDRP